MKCWIVAEAGVNWDGDRAKIVALIEAAKQAGASHVKFQAFNTDALVARRKITEQNTIALLRRNELTDDDLDMIQREAKRVGIPHFYSVFDPSQIERVLSRGACALKIGHAEWDWWELYKACHTGLSARGLFSSSRIWVSRQNVSTMSDDSGPAWLHGSRCNVLCVGKYPADGHPPHLGWIRDYSINGFSSHYTDYRIPAAAALRGAEYIEAHLMLGERKFTAWVTPVGADAFRVVESLPTEYTTDEPEREWSLSPEDFGKMVKLIREYETWL